MSAYCILARKLAASGRRVLNSKSKEAHGSAGDMAVTDKVIVLVTCAGKMEAKRIARSVVQARLAACVNVLSAPVESIFRWNGKVERAREVLLLIKTSKKRLSALRAAVERMHSYDVPEFIVLPIASGSPAYLGWLDDCLQPAVRKRKPQ